MPESLSTRLTEREAMLVLKALNLFRAAMEIDPAEIDALTSKISRIGKTPEITVGVYGGQVQWIMGSPFPIRVCDYDSDGEELPDLDELGQRCRMWTEPADLTVN